MYITTMKNERIPVKKGDYYQVVMRTRANRGCLRWLLIALVFLPAVLLYPFVGTPAVYVKLNDKVYLIDENQYHRLVEFIDNYYM